MYTIIFYLFYIHKPIKCRQTFIFTCKLHLHTQTHPTSRETRIKQVSSLTNNLAPCAMYPCCRWNALDEDKRTIVILYLFWFFIVFLQVFSLSHNNLSKSHWESPLDGNANHIIRSVTFDEWANIHLDIIIK